jgi:hypothetical protein
MILFTAKYDTALGNIILAREFLGVAHKPRSECAIKSTFLCTQITGAWFAGLSEQCTGQRCPPDPLERYTDMIFEHQVQAQVGVLSNWALLTVAAFHVEYLTGTWNLLLTTELC